MSYSNYSSYLARRAGKVECCFGKGEKGDGAEEGRRCDQAEGGDGRRGPRGPEARKEDEDGGRIDGGQVHHGVCVYLCFFLFFILFV